MKDKVAHFLEKYERSRDENIEFKSDYLPDINVGDLLNVIFYLNERIYSLESRIRDLEEKK